MLLLTTYRVEPTSRDSQSSREKNANPRTDQLAKSHDHRQQPGDEDQVPSAEMEVFQLFEGDRISRILGTLEDFFIDGRLSLVGSVLRPLPLVREDLRIDRF